MTDIVQRLRASVNFHAYDGDANERSVCGLQMTAAANEIDRLRAQVVALAQAPVAQGEPVAWMDDSGHPKHLSWLQSASDKRLYGPLRPLYAAPPPAVPQGYALVPIEPTQAMCQAGQWKAQEWPRFPLRISPIYQAMLAAAPTQDKEG